MARAVLYFDEGERELLVQALLDRLSFQESQMADPPESDDPWVETTQACRNLLDRLDKDWRARR